MIRDRRRLPLRRHRRIKVCIHALVTIILLLLICLLYHVLQRRSSKKFVNNTDLLRFANVTWPRRRIPRLIHQTYRTYTIPTVWNATVQSIISINAHEFTYRRWSHRDMDMFVRQHEPHFYWNTFVRYAYDIQRIDAFRYILLFHLGGIYLDMDDACHRPLRELVNTLEALDPNSTHLALLPAGELFGLQNNFLISTRYHPMYKQFISNLHLFNYNFLIYHVTVLLSVGPLYSTIQERFYKQSDAAVVRLLEHQTYRLIFWKTKGGTWFHRDTLMILDVYYNRHRILRSCFIICISLFSLSILIILIRNQRKRFRSH